MQGKPFDAAIDMLCFDREDAASSVRPLRMCNISSSARRFAPMDRPRLDARDRGSSLTSHDGLRAAQSPG